MDHASNTSSWETEAGEFQVQGLPGLHSRILSQKKKKTHKQIKKAGDVAQWYACLACIRP
jgi:hypothetical protein